MCISDLNPKADRLESMGEKCRVYVGFKDVEKTCDMVNREARWQILRIYDVGGKLLNGIKNIYVNSLACVRVEV